jgi:hypothetical protein
MQGLLRACEMLEPECLVHLLKAVKHLSMNATLLEVLQNANALEILIRILDEQSTGPHSTVSLLFLTSGRMGYSIVDRKCQITFSKHVIISADWTRRDRRKLLKLELSLAWNASSTPVRRWSNSPCPYFVILQVLERAVGRSSGNTMV